eukprot:jgi/Psemu1/313224/fgenesh1_kg.1127_\
MATPTTTPAAPPALQKMEVTWIVITNNGNVPNGSSRHILKWCTSWKQIRTWDDRGGSYTGHRDMAQVITQAFQKNLLQPKAIYQTPTPLYELFTTSAYASSSIANNEMCYALAFRLHASQFELVSGANTGDRGNQKV